MGYTLSSWPWAAIDIIATYFTLYRYPFHQNSQPNHHVILLRFFGILNHLLGICNISPSKRLKRTSTSTYVHPITPFCSLTSPTIIRVDVTYHSDLHPSPLLWTTSCNQLITHFVDNWQLKSFTLFFSDVVVCVIFCIKLFG